MNQVMKLRVLLMFFLLAFFSSCALMNTSTTSRNTPNNSQSAELKTYEKQLGISLDQDIDINLVREVSGWLGTPYQWAGNTKKGVDCSGFVQQVYKKVYKVNTPRTADGMADVYKKVNRNNLKPGDMVYFKINTARVGHVGIYLQDGYFVHASSSEGVMVNNLSETYYKKYFTAGGRKG